MAKGGSELLFLALAAGGFLILYNLARYSTATAQAGGGATGTGTGTGTPGGVAFAGTAPNAVEGVLNDVIPLTVSPAGRAFIQAQEGLSLTAYGDAGGQSIGYGHHIQPGENIPSAITQDQADALFNTDITAVENTINSLVAVPLTQSQFDALADFIYNVGPGAFAQSTLLRDLNASDYQGAANEFQRWIYAGHQVNATLLNRRTAEANLFASGGSPALAAVSPPTAVG